MPRKNTTRLPLKHLVPQSLSSWSSQLCLLNSGSKSFNDSHPSLISRYTTTSHQGEGAVMCYSITNSCCVLAGKRRAWGSRRCARCGS